MESESQRILSAFELDRCRPPHTHWIDLSTICPRGVSCTVMQVGPHIARGCTNVCELHRNEWVSCTQVTVGRVHEQGIKELSLCGPCPIYVYQTQFFNIFFIFTLFIFYIYYYYYYFLLHTQSIIHVKMLSLWKISPA